MPAIAAEKPAFITFGESADAPAGYLEMCEREPGLCQAAGVKAAPAPAPEPSVAETTENVVKEPIAIAVEELPAKLHTASLAKKDLTKRSRKTAATARKLAAADRKSRRSLVRTVRAINLTVNRAVRQRSDLEVYGTDEHWQPSGLGPSAVGDCEDIALQKKLLLLDAGFPADRLFLAVVFRSGVGLHTVLVARMDDGDILLDSATRPVWNWHKTPYSWLRVQSPDNPGDWYRVGTG